MNKRKLFIGVGAALLLIVGGLCFGKFFYEAKIRDDIQKSLAELPEPMKATAGNIDVSLLNKSVTIRDLKITYANNESLSFDVERIVATGVNTSAFEEGAGVVQLAKTITVDKSTFTGPTINYSIEKYFLEDITGDFNLLGKELVKALPPIAALLLQPDFGKSNASQRKLFSLFAATFQAYETVVIGKSSIKNYTYTLAADNKKVTATLGAIESGKSSIREMGPVVVSNISATVDGKQLLTGESLSMDSAILPSFVSFFASMSNPSGEAFLNAFSGRDFVINNLRGKNIVVYNPDASHTIFSLADTNFSYSAQETHLIDFSYKDLKIEKYLFTSAVPLSEEALQQIPDTITLEGAFKMSVTPKDTGVFDISNTIIIFKAAPLGAFYLGFKAHDIDLASLKRGMPLTGMLTHLLFRAVDTGALNLALTLDGKDTTPAERRSEMVADLIGNRDTLPNDTLKELLDAACTFLEKSGNTFILVLEPKKPLHIAQMGGLAFASPGELGLSFSTTPAP